MTKSNESKPETIIRDLHRLRESIVDSFGGDLHALTEDARRRQELSGRPIWRRAESVSKADHSNDGDTLAPQDSASPTGG